MKVASLPKEDRPREKLLRYGPAYLTDSELLALLLGFGTKGSSVLEVAQDLLSRFGGFPGLCSLEREELLKVHGIGHGKASLLLALGEILSRGKEMEDETLEKNYGYLQGSIRLVEEAYVLAVDSREKVVGVRMVAKGSEDGLVLQVKEVLRAALSFGARAYVFVHTHPSGAPFPSKQDIEFTDALSAASKKVGLRLKDHVSLCKSARFSFAQNGLMTSEP